MSARPDLRLVNTETGELAGCDRCSEVQVGDVENLERQVNALLRKIRGLERDRDAERQADPNRIQIIALIERWKEATGHPKSNANAADRFDVIRARLAEGYTIEQIELAVDGIGAFRYVVNGNRVSSGKPGQRHDRLGIALGGGEAVERFAVLGYQARKAL